PAPSSTASLARRTRGSHGTRGVRVTQAGVRTHRPMWGRPQERDAMSRLLLKWTRAVGDRPRGRYDDRGAGFVEYAGLLVLIATIVVAVVALDLDVRVSDAIRHVVGDILDD